jgi:hypothetical protein
MEHHCEQVACEWTLTLPQIVQLLSIPAQRRNSGVKIRGLRVWTLSCNENLHEPAEARARKWDQASFSLSSRTTAC